MLRKEQKRKKRLKVPKAKKERRWKAKGYFCGDTQISRKINVPMHTKEKERIALLSD
jgi:hypothetical protein